VRSSAIAARRATIRGFAGGRAAIGGRGASAGNGPAMDAPGARAEGGRIWARVELADVNGSGMERAQRGRMARAEADAVGIGERDVRR